MDGSIALRMAEEDIVLPTFLLIPHNDAAAHQFYLESVPAGPENHGNSDEPEPEEIDHFQQNRCGNLSYPTLLSATLSGRMACSGLPSGDTTGKKPFPSNFRSFSEKRFDRIPKHCLMESLAEFIYRRRFCFRFCTNDVLQIERVLIFMIFPAAAIFRQRSVKTAGQESLLSKKGMLIH